MKKNRCIVAGMIFVSGILVSNYGGAVTYSFFYFSLMIPVISWIYLLQVYCRFRIYQNIDRKTMVKEEHIPYYFQLSNEDKITYTSVQVSFLEEESTVETLSSDIVYCLLPGESIKRETTICCHYRGEYVVGINNVKVTDYLNLFSITYPSKSIIHIKVLPRVVELEQLVMALDDEDLKEIPYSFGGENTIPDIEVRNYERGDTMRRIHWKASARQHQLLTRKYMEEPKKQMLLYLDVSEIKEKPKTKLAIEDKIIESVLAITNYFYQHNTSVQVLYGAGQNEMVQIRQKKEFDEFYQVCSELCMNGEDTIDDILIMTQQYSQIATHLVIITGKLSDGLAIECYNMLQSGKKISILYIGSSLESEQSERFDTRIRLYYVPLEVEVSKILEGRADMDEV